MASEGEEREARLREKREKRKRRREGCLGDAGEMDREEVEAPKGGRPWTVSIAVAGSIVENAQKFDLKTALAGQIARAATIFNVDEVVVYDDLYHASTGHSHASTFLARVLQYLEMPQYLRRALVPVHPDLKLCGTLPPLDAPHHPRAHEWKEYREGVVLPPRNQPDAPPGTLSKFVNVGLPQEVKVYPPLPSECRVTIHMGLERPKGAGGKEPLKGKAVAPEEPRTHRGTYWGYTTRLCQGISGVFQECPYDGGYDLKVGTSERGEVVDVHWNPKPFRHALVVLGGVAGIEDALEKDLHLHGKEAVEVFDHYVNICPFQGSRTIRTEEALLITMTALRPRLAFAAMGAGSPLHPTTGA